MTPERICEIAASADSCDRGMVLREVLDLLVAADMDDHVLDEDDEVEYEKKREAELELFLIACKWAATLRQQDQEVAG